MASGARAFEITGERNELMGASGAASLIRNSDLTASLNKNVLDNRLMCTAGAPIY